MIFLESDGLRVEIAERGAEIVSVRDGDCEYIWQADPAFWAKHCPLLFPVCGRLRNFAYTHGGKSYKMGNHGFAQRMTFSAEQISAREAVFTLRENAETLAEYPFPFLLRQHCRLEGRTLRTEAEAQNTGGAPLDCSFGSHGAYAAGGDFTDWSVRFAKREDLVLTEQNASGQLTGRRIPYADDVQALPLRPEMFANDSLLFAGLRSRAATLEYKGRPAVKVEFPDYPYLLLWTKPGAPYIAIEPWNGLPDPADADGDLAHKPAILRLDPGESARGVHSITFFPYARG